MESVAVNLLPQEVIAQRQQKNKFSSVNRLSIGVLGLLAVVCAVLLFLRFTQAIQLKKAQASYDQASQRVDSVKEVSNNLTVLKRQLSSIQDFYSKNDKSKALFDLVAANLGQTLQVIEIKSDKNGLLTFTLSGTSVTDFDNFIKALTDPGKNQNLVKEIDLDGLSYSSELGFRFDVKILPAK